MAERRGGDKRRGRASPAKAAKPAPAITLVSARLHARNRRLGIFVVLLGAGALYLNLQTYVPSIRSGERA